MSKSFSMLEQYRRIPLEGIAKDLLRRVTLHHRIQGGCGLEKAVKEVATLFENMGFEVKLFEVPSSAEKRFVETPISWDLVEGFAEFKAGEHLKIVFNYVDHPTLVSAHSPPGEGCGELKLCKDLSNCDGEVLLVEAPGYVAYKEVSARLIALYDSKRYPEAVPYTGLFIRGNEIKNTSVINIPYSTALKLILAQSKGQKIEVCWNIISRYSTRSMYGLLAYKGDNPGILYVSHICHPKPGAHDNASGVVANILVAKLVESLQEKFSHAHLIIPEYSGTIFADKYLPWIPRAVLNLDMVGSKQWVTGSTLNIVGAPLFAKSNTAPYVYLATKMVLDEASSFGGFKLPASRYSLAPYTAGSDHDVTIMWGLDSVMLNEWPSKYYHTDMDDVDTISPPQVVNISIIAALAGNMISSNYRKEVMHAFKDLVKSWYSVESLKVGMDVSDISKILENQVELSVNFEHTPVSSRYLYKQLGLDAFLRLRNIKGAYTFLSVYAPLAYLNNINDFFELFQMENLLQWNREEKRLVEETWLRIKENFR